MALRFNFYSPYNDCVSIVLFYRRIIIFYVRSLRSDGLQMCYCLQCNLYCTQTKSSSYDLQYKINFRLDLRKTKASNLDFNEMRIKGKLMHSSTVIRRCCFIFFCHYLFAGFDYFYRTKHSKDGEPFCVNSL